MVRTQHKELLYAGTQLAAHSLDVLDCPEEGVRADGHKMFFQPYKSLDLEGSRSLGEEGRSHKYLRGLRCRAPRGQSRSCCRHLLTIPAEAELPCVGCYCQRGILTYVA